MTLARNNDTNTNKKIVASHHIETVDKKDHPLAALAGENTAIVVGGRMIATYQSYNGLFRHIMGVSAPVADLMLQYVDDPEMFATKLPLKP